MRVSTSDVRHKMLMYKKNPGCFFCVPPLASIESPAFWRCEIFFFFWFFESLLVGLEPVPCRGSMRVDAGCILYYIVIYGEFGGG